MQVKVLIQHTTLYNVIFVAAGLSTPFSGPSSFSQIQLNSNKLHVLFETITNVTENNWSGAEIKAQRVLHSTLVQL